MSCLVSSHDAVCRVSALSVSLKLLPCHTAYSQLSDGQIRLIGTLSPIPPFFCPGLNLSLSHSVPVQLCFFSLPLSSASQMFLLGVQVWSLWPSIRKVIQRSGLGLQEMWRIRRIMCVSSHDSCNFSMYHSLFYYNRPVV